MSATVQKTLYLNLKLLDFEKFLKKIEKRDAIHFTSKMFEKPNQKAFEAVTYFLLTILSKENQKLFKGCYPCLDKRQEADFRKFAGECFKKLEKEPSARISFLPLLLHNPGGDQFCMLYVALSNYVLTRQIKKKFNVLLDFEKLTETEAVQQIRHECHVYEDLETELLKDRQFMKSECEHFVERHKSLQTELEETEKKIQVCIKNLKQKVGDNDADCFIKKELESVTAQWELLHSAVRDLAKQCLGCRKTLDLRGETATAVFDPLEFLDVKTLSLSRIDSSLFTKHEDALKKFFKMVDELSSLELSQHNAHMQSATIQLQKQNNTAETNLSYVKESHRLLSKECKNLREKLLQDHQVANRREWFQQNLPSPLFPKLVFEAKSRSKALDFRSPIKCTQELRRHSDEYSFRFADISTFNYVAPTGVDDDCYLSPLREQSERENSSHLSEEPFADGSSRDLLEEQPPWPDLACD